MEKLITRKEAAKLLGISLTTLDEARNNGLISYVQYVPNGCVYFTNANLQEYIANAPTGQNPPSRKIPGEMCETKNSGIIAHLPKYRRFDKTRIAEMQILLGGSYNGYKKEAYSQIRDY